MTIQSEMTPHERRAAVALAGVFSTRMLGLFMILPVFALYAEHLSGATPFLVGLAIGIYGLTQGVFQIPFGLLSDRIGRKPVIYLGLAIFAVGSIVAAMADSMMGVVIGRALQGAGAIAAAVMALAADLTREEHRLKAMAVIGASIGLSFAASMVIGPLINQWVGLDGLFWLTAVLAVGGMAIVKFVVPQPRQSRFHRDAEPVPAQFKLVLRDGQLLRLDFGIFVLHMVLTAAFVTVPLVLRDQAGLASAHHWLVYLGVMVAAIGGMVPFIIIAEKKRLMKQIFVGAISVLTAALLAMAVLGGSLIGMVVALVLFFLAFNILEASLPSLVAKMSPADKKGTAMGVYSSSQFFGAFVGGAAGGWIHGQVGATAVFLFCAGLTLLWALWAATMRTPRYLSSYMVNVGPVNEQKARELEAEMAAVTGVAEAVVVAEDGVAYLKVDSRTVDEAALQVFSVNEDDDEPDNDTTVAGRVVV